MILSDHWIREQAASGMIEPFVEKNVRVVSSPFVGHGLGSMPQPPKKTISFGVSSYGYDMRLAREFKIFKNTKCAIIDPKAMTEDAFDSIEADDVVLAPPHSFVLARSVERFRIPHDVLAMVIGKSTYARCGLIVNCTPMEPCLSADSQALTSNGWVDIADVKIGDFLLTRRDDGVAEYRQVERKQDREFKGKMLHFKGKSVDQLVTPDHKMFVWKRDPRPNTYRQLLIPAEEVFGRHGFQLDRNVEWVAPEPAPQTVDINGLSFNLDPFLRFLGCYLGDGSAFHGADGGYHVKLAAVTRERKFVYFQQVLDELGIEARRHESGLHFYSKPLAMYLMQFGHAAQKYVDRRWLNLPAQKLGLLLEGLLASDGTQSTRTYTTISSRLANDVQEIVFKTGAGAIVRKTHEEINGHSFEVYRIRVIENTVHKINPSRHREVDYHGMVYDVTVPNHVFFMRRNGKASWTGNCWEGYLTIELSNTTPLPMKLYVGEGIAQALFFRGDRPADVNYAMRAGKYQDQGAEIVLPRM